MFGKKSGRVSKDASQNKKVEVAGMIKVPANMEQQDKVIAYFANGKKVEVILGDKVQVTPEQRRMVTEKLENGKITRKEVDDFLLRVMSPLQESGASLGKIFQEIVKDEKQKQILAVVTGHDAENWRQVNETELKYLLEKPVGAQPDYRTPVGFAVFREKFIDGIRDQATPEQLADYERAMDGLEERLYGRRFDYYRQICLLAGAKMDEVPAEAVKTEEVKETVEVPRDTQAEQPVDEIQEVIAEERKAEPVMMGRLAVLTPERSSEALGRALIEGDPWIQDGVEYRLGVATLMNAGVMPVYEAVVEGRGMMLSNAFQLSDGRGAALGYVPTESGVKVRAYYTDMKTGLWRYVPETIRGGRGEGIGQIGEGYSEASTVLPVTLQAALGEIVKSQGIREITNVNPDFILAGTAAAYRTVQEFREALQSGKARGDFYQDVDKAPVIANWQPSGKNKNVPQLISVNAEMAPDFARPMQRTVTYSALLGQVVLDSFPSRDGQLIWMFGGDDWGRVWLSNIEVVSPVTSTGCRRDWVDAGDLATPLYEYSTQTANYGDATDTRKGLVGMWNQYLSKIPLLQEYTRVRGTR